METLRHAYPYIREEDLQNALKYAEQKVEVALEILSWATSASVTSKSSKTTTRKAYLGYRVRTRAQPQKQEASLKEKDSESVVTAASPIIQRHEVSHDTPNDAKPVDTKPDESPENTDIEQGSPETIEWY
jgi:hypothetical protein